MQPVERQAVGSPLVTRATLNPRPARNAPAVRPATPAPMMMTSYSVTLIAVSPWLGCPDRYIPQVVLPGVDHPRERILFLETVAGEILATSPWTALAR